MNDLLREYLVLGIVIFFLILTFILIRLFIIKYFKVQSIKARSMSYPMILALTLLFTGFMAINSFGSYLLEVLVKILNDKLRLNVSTPNWLQSLSTFVVFAASVVILVYIYYNKYKKERSELERNRLKYEGENKREITAPPELPKESAIFHERVKEMFHLKYSDKGLDLKYDEKLKILFGEYEVGFRKYQIVALCKSNEKFEHISKTQVDQVYKELESCRKDFLGPKTENVVVDYFFLIEHGQFEHFSFPIHCFSEDGFLNQYIDFSPYLRTFVRKFENDRLPFSNVDSTLFNNTLAGTFVQPKFNGGCEDLPKFLNTWLQEDSQRHIALLGDYGTGKTSFLKYYVYSLASKILNNEKFDRYPVFISLTRTSPMHGGIKSAISDFLVNNKLEANYEMFDKLVHRGKIVFVLDGFDEMGFIGSHEQRFEQLNAIWQLATKGNKIIISGRPSYFPTEFEEKEGLNILDERESVIPQNRPYCSRIELDFFNEDQISESIKTYYKNKTEFEKFLWFIKENKSILDLCKRASLLHIVKETLPQLYENNRDREFTSALLIKYYIEHWVERQLSKSIVSAVKNEKIKKEFVFNFFRDLSGDYYNYEEGNLSIKLLTLRAFLKERFSALNLSSEEEVQGFEGELITGYFIERHDNSFHFVHKSFMEYFVSQRILNLYKNRDLKHDLVAKKNWSTEIENFIYESVEKQTLEKSEHSGVPLMCFLRYKNGRMIARLFSIYDSVLKGLFYFIYKYISLGRSIHDLNPNYKHEFAKGLSFFVLGLCLGYFLQTIYSDSYLYTQLLLFPVTMLYLFYSLLSAYIYGYNNKTLIYYIGKRHFIGLLFISSFIIASSPPSDKSYIYFILKNVNEKKFNDILKLTELIQPIIIIIILIPLVMTIAVLGSYQMHSGNLFPIIRAYELSMSKGYRKNLFFYSLILATRPDIGHNRYYGRIKIENQNLGYSYLPFSIYDVEVHESEIVGISIVFLSCQLYNVALAGPVEVISFKDTSLFSVDFSKIEVNNNKFKIIFQSDCSLNKESMDMLMSFIINNHLSVDEHFILDNEEFAQNLKVRLNEIAMN